MTLCRPTERGGGLAGASAPGSGISRQPIRLMDDDSSLETGQCESDDDYDYGTDIYSFSNTDQPHVSEVKRPTNYPHGNDNYCK